MKNKKNILFIFSALIVSLMFFAMGAEAASDSVSLSNPLTIGTEPTAIISAVIKGLLGIMGALTLVMVVNGGKNLLWSAGNPEKVAEGSKTILWAILGAVFVVVSYILLSGLLVYFAGPNVPTEPPAQSTPTTTP